MSWLEKNYEKAAIGGAAIVALGLVFMGWSSLNGIKEEFGAPLSGRGNNDPAVKDASLIDKAKSSMQLDRSITPADDNGRPVDLFVGVPLFVSKSDPTKPVDPYKGEPIHDPIPNTWWIDNKLDPGFADAPQRDPDKDGFNNLEEFTNKTDPNDPQSYPSLITKLKYVKDESILWVLRPGFPSDGGFTFKYEDNRKSENQNKTDPAVMITDGTLFFDKEPAKNRFKLLGSEQRKEFDKKTNSDKEFTIVKIEDQRPNKKGTVYEIPAPLSEERKMEHVKYDRTAVFSLEAIGLSGKEFKVEEGTSFALPPSATEKKYFTKEVTPDAVVIEYTDADGTKKTSKISKGGTQ